MFVNGEAMSGGRLNVHLARRVFCGPRSTAAPVPVLLGPRRVPRAPPGPRRRRQRPRRAVRSQLRGPARQPAARRATRTRAGHHRARRRIGLAGHADAGRRRWTRPASSTSATRAAGSATCHRPGGSERDRDDASARTWSSATARWSGPRGRAGRRGDRRRPGPRAGRAGHGAARPAPPRSTPPAGSCCRAASTRTVTSASPPARSPRSTTTGRPPTAAIFGGTTTIVDFAIPRPGEVPLEVAAVQQAKASQGLCDSALHGCVVEWDDTVPGQLRDMAAMGVVDGQDVHHLPRRDHGHRRGRSSRS